MGTRNSRDVLCISNWDTKLKKMNKMVTKEERTEQYLKYPLRLQWGDFEVCITQVVTTFRAELGIGDALIKTASHSTIHLAVLWANNELNYLERLNKDR